MLDCGFLFDVKRRTALDIHPTSMRFRPEGKKNILLVFESHIIFDMQLYFILDTKYRMHNIIILLCIMNTYVNINTNDILSRRRTSNKKVILARV